MPILLSNDFLVLQTHNKKLQCICKKTGVSRFIAKEELPSEASPIDFPIANDFLPFSSRPVESLEKLRELRTQVVLDYRKAKAREKAKNKPTTPRKKTLKLGAATKAKLESLPPALRAQLESALKEPKK